MSTALFGLIRKSLRLRFLFFYFFRRAAQLCIWWILRGNIILIIRGPLSSVQHIAQSSTKVAWSTFKTIARDLLSDVLPLVFDFICGVILEEYKQAWRTCKGKSRRHTCLLFMDNSPFTEQLTPTLQNITLWRRWQTKTAATRPPYNWLICSFCCCANVISTDKCS